MPRSIPGGFFIAFEGIEGSGKSTQLVLLAQALRPQGFDVVEVRQPGSTPHAEKIREIVLEVGWNGVEGVLLFYTALSHLVRTVIRPALAQNKIVLCDRFSESALTIPVYGRGQQGLLPLVWELERQAVGATKPDLTLIFDLPVLVAQERIRKRQEQTRFDQEVIDFHEVVAQAYRELARLEPRRRKIIKANALEQDVHCAVCRVVEEQLLRRQILNRMRRLFVTIKR